MPVTAIRCLALRENAPCSLETALSEPLREALIASDDEMRRERIRRLIEGSREGRERVLDPVEEREAEHEKIERPLRISKGFYIRSLCLRRALRGSEKDHRGDREPSDH